MSYYYTNYYYSCIINNIIVWISHNITMHCEIKHLKHYKTVLFYVILNIYDWVEPQLSFVPEASNNQQWKKNSLNLFYFEYQCL